MHSQVGPRGVLLTDAYVNLQRFFVGLYGRGTLLCLCSRNNSAEDVLAVWRERGAEMVLTLDHIVAHAVRMGPKSEGMRRLAETLCLGVDALAIVDDSATECAEVAANLPQVCVCVCVCVFVCLFVLLF